MADLTIDKFVALREEHDALREVVRSLTRVAGGGPLAAFKKFEKEFPQQEENDDDETKPK